MSQEAIVLFAHGARDPEWAVPARQVAAEVQRLRPRLPSRSADEAGGPSTALVVWRPRPADRDPRSR